MKIKHIIYLAFIFTNSIYAQADKKDDRPNIILILSDDVGFEEFSLFVTTKSFNLKRSFF